MSKKNKKNRLSIEELPRAEQELSPEEAKDVKGGLLVHEPAPPPTSGSSNFGVSDGRAAAEGLAVNKAANALQE